MHDNQNFVSVYSVSVSLTNQSKKWKVPITQFLLYFFSILNFFIFVSTKSEKLQIAEQIDLKWKNLFQIWIDLFRYSFEDLDVSQTTCTCLPISLFHFCLPICSSPSKWSVLSSLNFCQLSIQDTTAEGSRPVFWRGESYLIIIISHLLYIYGNQRPSYTCSISLQLDQSFI